MVESINTRILTNAEFEKDNTLKAKYQSYDQYLASQLRSTSIHTYGLANLKTSTNPSEELRKYFNAKYEAFNQKSEELIAQYQALAPIASAKKNEYTKYATKIDSLGDNAKLTEKSKLNRLKNESTDAEFSYDAALKTALYHTHSATQFLA